MEYLEQGINGFRLLTEYHSFLSNWISKTTGKVTGFRLLTEYHSFLLEWNGKMTSLQETG